MARQTIEHKITEYFQSQPLASANVLFGIVKGTMQTRTINQDAGPAVKRRKAGGGRKPRAVAPADPAAPPKRRGRKPRAQAAAECDQTVSTQPIGEPVPLASAEQQAAVSEITVGA